MSEIIEVMIVGFLIVTACYWYMYPQGLVAKVLAVRMPMR
jgi:hypothetical protein